MGTAKDARDIRVFVFPKVLMFQSVTYTSL